jgi:hypothetical protein
MHSAIVVVAMSAVDQSGWNNFLSSINEKLPRPLGNQQGVSRLAENVWLLNFRQNPAAFARLVDTAARYKLPCEILQLGDPPQWLPVEFDPKPIEGHSEA